MSEPGQMETRTLLRCALLDTARTLRKHLRLQQQLGVDGAPPTPTDWVVQPVADKAPAHMAPPRGPRRQQSKNAAAKARSAFEKQKPARQGQKPQSANPIKTQRPGQSASTLNAFQKLAKDAGPRPIAEIPREERPANMDAVRAELGDCTRCKLHRGRTNIVFGVGDPKADLMFIGEGPGAQEDRQGEPFVGRAGQLLTKIIGAMGLSRNDVYIANIVKCRPPRNRDPEPDEVAMCEPFLVKQITVVQPRVIVTLGRVASQALLKIRTPITRLRGNWQDYRGIPVMPTLHPAYLLRHPPAKRAVWNDVQDVMRRLGLAGD